MLELRTHLHLLDIFKLTVELAWNQWSKEVCSAELSKPRNKLFQFMQRKLRQINWLFLDHWHQGPKTESVHPCWLYLMRNRILFLYFSGLWWYLSYALTWGCFSVQLHHRGSVRTVWHDAKLPAVTFIGSESMWKERCVHENDEPAPHMHTVQISRK